MTTPSTCQALPPPAKQTTRPSYSDGAPHSQCHAAVVHAQFRGRDTGRRPPTYAYTPGAPLSYAHIRTYIHTAGPNPYPITARPATGSASHARSLRRPSVHAPPLAPPPGHPAARLEHKWPTPLPAPAGRLTGWLGQSPAAAPAPAHVRSPPKPTCLQLPAPLHPTHPPTQAWLLRPLPAVLYPLHPRPPARVRKTPLPRCCCCYLRVMAWCTRSRISASASSPTSVACNA